MTRPSPGCTSGTAPSAAPPPRCWPTSPARPTSPAGSASSWPRPTPTLTFEKGPSVDVHLQWATYFDAADQAGQSRIYGGIHILPDDFGGRSSGSAISGVAAAQLACKFYDGTAER